jgi:hypothetical protein
MYKYFSQWSHRLVRKYCNKIAIDWLILPIQLSHPSRVSIEVFGDPSTRALDHLGSSEC